MLLIQHEPSGAQASTQGGEACSTEKAMGEDASTSNDAIRDDEASSDEEITICEDGPDPEDRE